MVLHSTLAGSPLVRLLGDTAPRDPEAPGMDVAERLSLWLHAFDAIDLQAAHQAIRAVRTPAAGKPSNSRAPTPGLTQDVQRVRSVLAKAIAQDPAALAAGKAADPPSPEAGYRIYHERHAELQQQMELMIGPLRAHVRETLGRASAKLRQLAALDAALAQVLGPREQALLPRIPVLLKRRFEQLRLAHAQAVADGAQDDDGAGWRDTFAGEWRQALLAELDLRLAPVAGLAEALANDLDPQG
jgi:hypothetical protein